MRRLLYLLIPLTLVAAACGGDDHDMSSMGSDDTEAADGHDEHDENSPVPDDARTIEVTATSFAFEPEIIEVEAEEPIAIELYAEDAEHDFVIEDLELHVVAAEMGKSVTGGFLAPAAGEYHFYCAVPGHRAGGMEGTLVVT